MGRWYSIPESILSEPNTLHLTLLSTLGEPVHLALGHLTALVWVSHKTGPVRSQNSTEQAAVGRMDLETANLELNLCSVIFWRSRFLSPRGPWVSSVVEEGIIQSESVEVTAARTRYSVYVR